MKDVEDGIADFRQYAKILLDDHVTELNLMDNSQLMNNNLARIKVFNAHLKALKEELDAKVNDMLHEPMSEITHTELGTILKKASGDHIDEFLRIGFIRNRK